MSFMKIRKFYPRQVIRKLYGRHNEFDSVQKAVLKYAFRSRAASSYYLMINNPNGFSYRNLKIFTETEVGLRIWSEAYR